MWFTTLRGAPQPILLRYYTMAVQPWKSQVKHNPLQNQIDSTIQRSNSEVTHFAGQHEALQGLAGGYGQLPLLCDCASDCPGANFLHVKIALNLYNIQIETSE